MYGYLYLPNLTFHSNVRQARPGGTIIHFGNLNTTTSSLSQETPNLRATLHACLHDQPLVRATALSSGIKPPHIPSSANMEHLHQYNRKYLGIQDYNQHSAQLGENFYNKLCSITPIGKCIQDNQQNGCHTPPTLTSRPSIYAHQTAYGPKQGQAALSNDTGFSQIGPKLTDLQTSTQEQYSECPHSSPTKRNSKNQQPQKLESVSHLDWKRTIPNKQTLLQTGFGQPSLAHSFNQEACFETVLLFIIKSGHSNPCDTFNLLLAHPLHAHLASAVVNLSDYNFTWLRDYNLHWATQKMVNRSKLHAFLACLLHYNLDTSLLMSYLGNNYTGAYRNVPEVIKTLQHYKIDKNLINQYARVMTTGCPNRFVANTSRNNALHYW